MDNNFGVCCILVEFSLLGALSTHDNNASTVVMTGVYQHGNGAFTSGETSASVHSGRVCLQCCCVLGAQGKAFLASSGLW